MSRSPDFRLEAERTAAVKQRNPETRVFGVEPELAADAQESFRSGQLATWPPEKTTRTICDGLRTQSLGKLNFLHIRHFVNDFLTVSEDEIREAMRALSAAGIMTIVTRRLPRDIWL